MRTHEHNGRLWLEIGQEPYRRKDGTATQLIVWATQCAVEDCEEAVEIKTPADSNPAKSQAFGVAHCPAHKLTREEATARWVDAINRGRKSKKAS